MTDAAVIPIPDRTHDAIVGGNVKYLMIDRDLEQSQLAGRLGIDQSTLSLKLAGKRKWTVAELVAVSDIFAVSIDGLARRRGFDPVIGGGALLVMPERGPFRARTGDIHGGMTAVEGRVTPIRRKPAA